MHFRLYEKDSYIDLLNATVGVTSDEIFTYATAFTIQGIELKVIHINQLISNKLALNTSKDSADAEALIKIRDKNNFWFYRLQYLLHRYFGRRFNLCFDLLQVRYLSGIIVFTVIDK